MNFKKRVNGSWTDTPHYIHNTSTDTITTLPADLYADGTDATVTIYGNMAQTSTPTPDNPIQPQECGERTGNLWDEDYTGISNTITYKPIYVGDGNYTLSSSIPNGDGGVKNLFLLAGNVSSGASSASNGVASNILRTVTAIDGYVTIAFRSSASGAPYSPANYDTMLNTGSTALPYEPYGYKIPILSNSQTTNVYLGEVQTTRNIIKKVLDGTETTWTSGTTQGRMAFYWKTGTQNPTGAYVICTHYKAEYIAREGVCFITSNNVAFIDSNFQSIDDFKNFLADEYEAGHPVTVWYVNVTPMTRIVNEPIRKIGDYADTVSGIIIPTIAGANTLSVGTALQPSEVTVNYKGWHPVSAVHERENGTWD